MADCEKDPVKAKFVRGGIGETTSKTMAPETNEADSSVTQESSVKILPLVDYTLVSVPAEAEKRELLLASTEIDENGVAHTHNEKSGALSSLVAVRINDKGEASVVPLRKTDAKSLALELPGDKPSRIGFFIGHHTPNLERNGVFRIGLYPGVPLTTQSLDDEHMQEIMYKLGGIKPSETDQQGWAEQIGLFEGLGFDTSASRGMFSRSHRASRQEDTWQESPIVVVPDEIQDMVRHFDPSEVRKNEFQIQIYGTKPVIDNLSLFNYREENRGDLLSFGTKSASRGMTIGFGEAVSRQAKTTSTKVSSLQGAFHVVVLPKNTA